MSNSEHAKKWLEEKWYPKESTERKRQVLLAVDDLIAGFLYYDRKECESMGVGAVEWSILNGDISLEDVIIRFGEGLLRSVRD